MYVTVICKISEYVRMETLFKSFMFSGGGPVHARVPIHAHPYIYPKQS